MIFLISAELHAKESIELGSYWLLEQLYVPPLPDELFGVIVVAGDANTLILMSPFSNDFSPISVMSVKYFLTDDSISLVLIDENPGSSSILILPFLFVIIEIICCLIVSIVSLLYETICVLNVSKLSPLDVNVLFSPIITSLKVCELLNGGSGLKKNLIPAHPSTWIFSELLISEDPFNPLATPCISSLVAFGYSKLAW